MQTISKNAGVKQMDMIKQISIKCRAQAEPVDYQPPQKGYNNLLIHPTSTKEMDQLADKQLMLQE